MLRPIVRGMLSAVFALSLTASAHACWFTSCFGGGSTAYYPPPQPAPTFAAFAPAPVQSCCNPCNTCNPCAVQQTCGFVPQTCYQPITTYTPVTTLKPVSSGCCDWLFHTGSTTSYRQVTNYVPQTSYMPVTTFRQQCTSCAPVATCNSCSSCSSCGSTSGSCGCDSCGGSSPVTTYFGGSSGTTTSSGCSSCGASASISSGSSNVMYGNITTGTTVSSPNDIPASNGQGTNRTFEQTTPKSNENLKTIVVPDSKAEPKAPAVNPSNSSLEPKLLDPRDKTAGMPVIRTWTGMPNARPVSEIRPSTKTITVDLDAPEDVAQTARLR